MDIQIYSQTRHKQADFEVIDNITSIDSLTISQLFNKVHSSSISTFEDRMDCVLKGKEKAEYTLGKDSSIKIEFSQEEEVEGMKLYEISIIDTKSNEEGLIAGFASDENGHYIGQLELTKTQNVSGNTFLSLFNQLSDELRPDFVLISDGARVPSRHLDEEIDLPLRLIRIISTEEQTSWYEGYGYGPAQEAHLEQLLSVTNRVSRAFNETLIPKAMFNDLSPTEYEKAKKIIAQTKMIDLIELDSSIQKLFELVKNQKDITIGEAIRYAQKNHAEHLAEEVLVSLLKDVKTQDLDQKYFDLYFESTPKYTDFSALVRQIEESNSAVEKFQLTLRVLACKHLFVRALSHK